MRVLGIDPGTATTGFGIVEIKEGRLITLDYGTIKTTAGIDMPLRLLKINGELNRLLEEYQPDVVAVEEIFHHKNAKTVVAVAQARGVILLAASLAQLPVAEYTPLQVKQAVVGYGQAEKRQVQMKISVLDMEKLKYVISIK